MRVLGLAGSPRVRGNSDLLLDKVLAGAEEKGARTKKIYLNELEIKPCQACKACRKPNTDGCIYKDDMELLYQELLVADVWVLATPIYWWGPSAQLKLTVDRWYALMPVKDKLRHKRTALIITMADGNPQTAKPTVEMFEDAFSYLHMNFIDKLIVTASDKGAVQANFEALEDAFKLGTQLVRPK